MALVVLIENPEDFDQGTWNHIEQDMRRWWRHRCVKHVLGGEVFFQVGDPVKFNLYGGVERLQSFGVRARVVRRNV